MRRSLLIAGLCLMSIFAAKAQLYEYRNPYGREYWKRTVREEFLTYRNVRQALAERRDSLENGEILSSDEWKMTVTSDTATAIRTKDLENWQTVTVPFVRSEIKDPLYTPSKMPVMEEVLDMPRTKEFTVLRTDAIVKFDYIDKAMFLHIGAVSGKATVYINGKKKAVIWESFIPHEIKVTSDVARGRNSVAIVIEPYSEESLVERWQRQFSPCILGDVYFHAQPKIRMFDFVHKTTLDPTYTNGLLEAGLILKTELINTHAVTVYYDLYDMQGKIVNSDYKNVEIGWHFHDTIRFTSSIKKVNLWSAKNPYLYTIIYRVKRDGRTLENVARKVGFRQIDIKEDSLLINGKAEPIYGINADLYPELTAAYSSKVRIEDILKGLKKQGFNAVRTPYPLRRDFYDIADKLGIYVSETAPVCSHGLEESSYKGGTLANNPAWDSVYITRAVDTYEKGKSHTCIIMWELGEDAGNGYCICNAYRALRYLENYRPISYSGAGYQWVSDICMDGTLEPRGGKPYIPSRMKYDPAFWGSHQGGFLDETIEGRVAGSDYTESTVVVENQRPQEDTIVLEQPKKKISIFKKKTGNAPLQLTTIGNSAITAQKTAENCVTIHNGTDTNLNKYSIIHGVEVDGTIEPIEVFSLDVEPGGEKSVTLMKTSKKKKAYLLIGDIAKIEL